MEDLANVTNAPFICLTETHLNPHVLDAEIQIKNYTLFRSDRVGRSHGGVCIYVRNNLATSVILKDSNAFCDTLVLRIHKLDLLLINIYRPPKCPSNLFLQSLEAIKQIINNFEEHDKRAHDILLTSDCNFPDIKWVNGCGHLQEGRDHGHLGEDRRQALALLEFAEEYFLHQVINTPTRRNNILDLVFTNNLHLINDHSIICNDRLSDHYIIKFNLNYDNIGDNCHSAPKKDYYKTNLHEFDFYGASDELWYRFNILVQDVNFEELFENCSPTQKLETFYSKVSEIAEIIFEKKNSEEDVKIFSSKNKIPRKIRILMRNKGNLSKSILKCKSGYKIGLLRQRLHNIESELETFYNERRNNQEQEAIKKIKKNPKFFYSYAKKFSKLKSGIGPFLDDEGDLISDNYEMAEMLRKQYEKSFSTPFENAKIYDPISFFASENEELSFSNICITFEDVKDAIDCLSPHAAPGPDSFPAILLKKGKMTLCHPLTDIFRSSLETGEVPNIFKMAFITPLHKGDAKTLPVNYRPVSLTSHLAKTFERVIRKSLVAYLEVNQKMNPKQHGFRQGRSCLSQLLEHYDNILKIMEEGHNADCIYLDFSKCFDKIDIGLLSHKMKLNGINSKIGLWLHNFLVDRQQFVITGDAISEPSTVISGIPQGTVLGPILFLLFISDIDNNIEATASMFADDTRLVNKIDTEDDVENMQADLNQIYSWAEVNNMQFNNKKFELIRYGCNEEVKNSTFYLSANDEIIEEKESLRDLGVIVNNEANFNDHVEAISSKAKQKSGWIFRTFKCRQPFFLKLLWKQLVQPHLDYCSQLMNLNSRNLSKFENIQRFYTRRIRTLHDCNYWERLKICQMLSQQRRMERYKILYIWKILEGKVPNCGIDETNNLRLGRLCMIPVLNKNAKPKVKSLRENSFQIVGPRLFNCLPPKIRNLTKCSIEEFKSKLDEYLACIPDEPKLPGYTPSGTDLFSGQPSNCLVDQIRNYNQNKKGGG